MNTPSTPAPEPSCGACAFWDTTWGGLCRRWGPDRIVVSDVGGVSSVVSGWPVTRATDWCGEFEAAEATP